MDFVLEEYNPKTAKPIARPPRWQRNNDLAGTVSYSTGGTPLPTDEWLARAGICADPCLQISPEAKRLLDATGRTDARDPRRPRNTNFVRAVIEEAKRDLMW